MAKLKQKGTNCTEFNATKSITGSTSIKHERAPNEFVQAHKIQMFVADHIPQGCFDAH